MTTSPAHIHQVKAQHYEIQVRRRPWGNPFTRAVYRRQPDHCTRCAKPLGKGIAYMVREYVFTRFYESLGEQRVAYRQSYAPVCRACTAAEERRECQVHDICDCPGCGRRMRVASFTVTACSENCRRRALRRRYRMKQLDCVVCNKPFSSARSDAVYCSNVCRQRHHRQVHAESARNG